MGCLSRYLKFDVAKTWLKAEFLPVEIPAQPSTVVPFSEGRIPRSIFAIIDRTLKLRWNGEKTDKSSVRKWPAIAPNWIASRLIASGSLPCYWIPQNSPRPPLFNGPSYSYYATNCSCSFLTYVIKLSDLGLNDLGDREIK